MDVSYYMDIVEVYRKYSLCTYVYVAFFVDELV